MGFSIRSVLDLGGPSGLFVAPNIVILRGLKRAARQHVIVHELAHAINAHWGEPIKGPRALVEAEIEAAIAMFLLP